MQISQIGLDLIKKFEGFKPQAYSCPAGILSIGYGHAIDKKKENFSTITKSQADKLLISDVTYASFVIHKYVKVLLTQGKFDALCSLVYNWGSLNFIKSFGLKYLNIGNYNKAAHEFFSFETGVVRIKGEFSKGLYNRRQAEMELWNDV